VQEHPEILQRAVADGHEIGNHSWDHKALNKQGEGGLRHELADTSAEIIKATGKPVTLMRPPYGATNARLNRAIEKEYGMKVILWSVDPLDWKRPGPQVVSQRILKETQPGAIILSHDIHPGTIEAMPATLDALLAKGYKFVTVSELLSMESKQPAPASKPSEPKPAPAPPSPRNRSRQTLRTPRRSTGPIHRPPKASPVAPPPRAYPWSAESSEPSRATVQSPEHPSSQVSAEIHRTEDGVGTPSHLARGLDQMDRPHRLVRSQSVRNPGTALHRQHLQGLPVPPTGHAGGAKRHAPS